MLQGYPITLSELIKYRTECPFCQTKLITYFHSTRKQSIRYEDHRLVAIFDMNGLNKTQVDYKVGYSFSLDDDSFQIEFFTDAGTIHYNAVSLDMMKKFMEFHRNLGAAYSFSRKCTFCKKYSYSSGMFGLDFKNQKTPEIKINTESFNFVLSKQDDCKIIVMNNRYPFDDYPPFTEIHCWRGEPSDANYDRPYPAKHQLLVLPLVPFVSVQETSSRLNGLLTFA